MPTIWDECDTIASARSKTEIRCSGGPMKKHEAILAVISVTLALLVNEIMLSAIFNVLIGALNTVTAIAVALLGLSSSGIIAYIDSRFRPDHPTSAFCYKLLAMFVIATITCTVIIMNLPVNHGDFYYHPRITATLIKFIAYIISVIPFLMGGLCINIFFFSYSKQISQLYFADLAGAAAGCLVAVLMLGSLGAPRAIIYAALPAALVCFGFMVSRGKWQRGLIVFLPFLLLELLNLQYPLLSVKKLNTFGEVNSPEYRGFYIKKNDLDFEKWAFDAWTIVRNEKIPQQWEKFGGWGLSKYYKGPVPKIRFVNFNLRFSTYITEFDGNLDKLRPWLDADLISLHYLIGRRYKSVLNIGAGGGREVLNALNHDAEKVTAVDISEVTTNDIMKGYLREFSGNLFFDPRVSAHADEGRSFLERSQLKYDLIDFAIVGGTNLEKLDVINIDDLFTKDALETYLRHLHDSGVFSYSMYNTRSDLIEQVMKAKTPPFIPYIPAVKTLVGLRSTLENHYGIKRFRDHVLVAGLHGVIDKNYDLIHIITSMSPFSDAERERFSKLCETMGFVTFYPSQKANLFSEIIDEPNLEGRAATLPFSIQPTTDDKPFHYALNAHSLGGLATLRMILMNPLVSTGVMFAIIGILFLVGPASWATRSHVSNNSQVPWLMLFYFACIGCGYMMVEISALLKIQFYLGKPIYSFSVALFSFLLASGIGSHCTRYFKDQSARGATRWLGRMVLILIIYGQVFCLLWPMIFKQTIGLMTTARAAIAIVMIFPMAFIMGMFFPIGIRIVSEDHRGMIPWVWAINGCLSVFGIFGCRIAALFLGFNASLLVGLGLYFVTWGCAWSYTRRENHRLRAFG